MNYEKVNDSGQQEKMATGSQRDSRADKGRYDLLSPLVLFRDARHMENGSMKYGERNWEKGQPSSRYLDSAIRHLMRYLEGDRSEDHLAAARWNVGGIVFNEMMIERGLLPPELHDLPSYMPVPWPGQLTPE
jgi:hypothetical protein